MDEKDRKIIEMLQKNSRKPFTEIAEEIGVSEATIRKRVKSLQEENIIQRFTIEVDPKKLGYNTITLLGSDVEPKYLLEATQQIKNIEETRKVYTSSGDHMVMAEIWAKDSRHLNEILSEKISKIEGVKNLCPTILTEKISEN